MTDKQPGHGLDTFLAALKELDGKTISMRVIEDKADFDRKVRESIDRQHRRAQIAGG
jgi:hypothetical protein